MRYINNLTFCGLVFVNVIFLYSLSLLLVYIYQPISCHLAIATICFSKYFFLSYLSHSDIIKLSPYFIESVIDESIIMTTMGISIMNAYGMKMIGSSIHALVCLLDQVIELLHLRFHFMYLLFSLVCIVVEYLDNCIFLWHLLLLVKRVKRLNFRYLVQSFIGHTLILEKHSSKLQYFLYIIISSIEFSVLE